MEAHLANRLEPLNTLPSAKLQFLAHCRAASRAQHTNGKESSCQRGSAAEDTIAIMIIASTFELHCDKPLPTSIATEFLNSLPRAQLSNLPSF